MLLTPCSVKCDHCQSSGRWLPLSSIINNANFDYNAANFVTRDYSAEGDHRTNGIKKDYSKRLFKGLFSLGKPRWSTMAPHPNDEG